MVLQQVELNLILSENKNCDTVETVVISWDILGGPPDWLGNKTASPMGF